MIFVPATRYGVPRIEVRCQNRWYSYLLPALTGCFLSTCCCSDTGTLSRVKVSRSELPTIGLPGSRSSISSTL